MNPKFAILGTGLALAAAIAACKDAATAPSKAAQRPGLTAALSDTGGGGGGGPST